VSHHEKAAPGPVVQCSSHLDRADGGVHPHQVAVGDAEIGSICWVDEHHAALAAGVQTGQLVQKRIHRMSMAAVAQLERVSVGSHVPFVQQYRRYNQPCNCIAMLMGATWLRHRRS